METLEGIYKFAYDTSRGEGIILDTNVLLVFFVGIRNPAWIKDLKLTNTYDEKDFKIILQIIKPFRKIIITDGVLTEVTNHLKNARTDSSKLHLYFCSLADYLRDSNKVLHPIFKFSDWNDQEIARLCKFGFTDISMFEYSSKNRTALLTDDGPFHTYAKGQIPVIKYSVIKYSNISLK